MFRTFITSVKNNKSFANVNRFFNQKEKNNIKLGRFDICKNEEQEKRKAIFNAADHCGDIICGNPTIVKNIVVDHKMNISVIDYHICCQLLGMSNAIVCKNCPIY